MARQSWRRAVAALLGAGLTGGVLVAVPTGAAAATATVTFHGVSVAVPEDWPVIRLDGVAGCVRFDQHAVYLGDPASSTCPADVAGHTEAVHLTRGEVLDARSPANDVGGGRSRTGGTTIHPDLVVSHSQAPVRVVVTSGADAPLAATIADSVQYAADALTGPPVSAPEPAPKDRIVAPRFAPERPLATPSVSQGAVSQGAVTATPAVSRRALRAVQAARAGTTFTGLGFDTCLTPSLDAMAAWAASPYRAVNMYVGGASRGCPNQPNLNSTWVDTVVGQGWTLIPTYVGLQAPCATRYPNRVSAAGAVAEGTASADDAINVLNAIGLGVGSIVYFDMEAYDTGNAGCVAAVQAFLDAWTVRLHARGYLSGVYTSSSPMGPTLVARLGDASFHQPDDIWFARWNGSATTTGDPAIPDTAWASHQRIHQYLGGHVETYGGVSINIDSNAVDADTAPGAPLAEGTFLSRRGEAAVYRIAGGAPLPVTSWAAFGAPQPVEVVSATRWRLLPTYPRNGSFLQGGSGRVFQVVGGVARFVPSWDAFGGPQPTTLVDQAALDNAGTGGVFNHLKRGAPAVAMLAPAGGVGVAAATQRVRWVGAFTAPAIRSYDLRYRRSRYTGGFGPWTSPKPWQNTAASAKTKGLLAGYNYCYQVRATSRAGQTTPWSASRCAARALDDRSMTATSGWRRWKAKAFYTRTVTSTTRKGVTLTVRGAAVTRVGVVATTCAACGRLSVIVNGRRVATVSLVSPTTVRRAVLMTPRFGLRTGNVTVKTLTGGRRVQVDGLVLTRT